MLETWYAANIRHPYPDDVTTAALATGGGISVKQVRKWLANRRVRSCNTLPYNGAVHPRRLRRLRRQQGEADRDDVTEPRQPMHSTPMSSAAVGPSPSVAGFRVAPAAESLYDSAFHTSTPLSGAFRRSGGVHFEVNNDSVRHHPYSATRRIASTWTPSTATPLTHRSAHFGAAAANFPFVRQMATRQLNIFNVFNSI